MASVVNVIQALGVEVEHIPSGCTYLCQPVDIGINKPYKKHLQMRWECWMMAEGLINGTTSPPAPLTLNSGVVCKKRNLSRDSEKFMETWRVFMVS